MLDVDHENDDVSDNANVFKAKRNNEHQHSQTYNVCGYGDSFVEINAHWKFRLRDDVQLFLKCVCIFPWIGLIDFLSFMFFLSSVSFHTKAQWLLLNFAALHSEWEWQLWKHQFDYAICGLSCSMKNGPFQSIPNDHRSHTQYISNVFVTFLFIFWCIFNFSLTYDSFGHLKHEMYNELLFPYRSSSFDKIALYQLKWKSHFIRSDEWIYSIHKTLYISKMNATFVLSPFVESSHSQNIFYTMWLIHTLELVTSRPSQFSCWATVEKPRDTNSST